MKPLLSSLPSHRQALSLVASSGGHQTSLFDRAPFEDAVAASIFGEALELCFYGRVFISTTLPHSQPDSAQFTRRCHYYTLTLTAPEEIGLPYGKYPRLALAWLTTAALRAGSPRLTLGRTLSDWASSLGITPTHGPRGTIPALRAQLHRLLSTNVIVSYDTSEMPGHPSRRIGAHQFHIAEHHDLDLESDCLTIRLDDRFYQALCDRPVPLDLRILKKLRSPLMMDLYAWLSFRALRTQRIRRPEPIAWEHLMRMFGSDYKEPRQFRFAMLAALKQVIKVYPSVRVEAGERALTLLPYPPHVPQKKHPPRSTMSNWDPAPTVVLCPELPLLGLQEP